MHLHDPALRRRIETLHQASSEFARFWDEHAVLGREGGERTFHHPDDGFVCYEQVTFSLAEHTDLRLTMLIRNRAKSNTPRTRKKARTR